MIRRRVMAIVLAVGVAAGAVIACAQGQAPRVTADQANGRLHVRPGRPAATAAPLEAGQQRLAIGADRDVLLYVPRDLPAGTPAPLVVLLHGATGTGKGVMTRVGASELAERFKVIVLAPDSRERTWDMVTGHYGPDVAFLETALEHLFARVAIDPKRVAIAGFSDGATYALSLGLNNGTLFTRIIAFSPGFIVANRREGRPDIFVSHGTRDEILRIDTTSHRLVPELREAGYAVQYREFDGPHTVPASIAQEAFEWMLGKPAAMPSGGR